MADYNYTSDGRRTKNDFLPSDLEHALEWWDESCSWCGTKPTLENPLVLTYWRPNEDWTPINVLPVCSTCQYQRWLREYRETLISDEARDRISEYFKTVRRGSDAQ